MFGVITWMSRQAWRAGLVFIIALNFMALTLLGGAGEVFQWLVLYTSIYFLCRSYYKAGIRKGLQSTTK